MNRRSILVTSGGAFSVLLSGCLDSISAPDSGSKPVSATPDGSKDASGTSLPSANIPRADCDAVSRPPTPDPDADPPGDTTDYTYPPPPESLEDDDVREYAERFERAYRLNKRYEIRGSHLNQLNVRIEGSKTFDAPEGATIAQVKYTYFAKSEGDDGSVVIDSPLLYASYYIDERIVLRAVDKKLQEDVSRLVVDPIEQGQPVECF